jgi:archaellin
MIIMAKAFNNKRGTMATGSMILVIASILTSGAAGTVILGSVQDTGNQATAVADDSIANLCNGFIVVDATGHYKANNLTELQFLMKLSSGSDPIDLTKVMIFVTTENGETPYQFENSTHTFSTRIYAGANTTVLLKGELLKLTVPDMYVPVGGEVVVKLFPEMGQILSMKFTVPDSLGNEFVMFQ